MPRLRRFQPFRQHRVGANSAGADFRWLGRPIYRDAFGKVAGAAAVEVIPICSERIK